MINELTDYYLSAMGIQVWKQRDTKTAPKAAFQTYDLVNPQGNYMATLLLESVEDQQEQINKKIHRLLDTILFSFNLKREAAKKVPEQIIMMGQNLAQQLQVDNGFNAAIPLIVTHHPLALLKQANLKAKLWQDLQKFITNS